MERVAVVCAYGLGDALLSMILSHNLALSGIQVTTFSTILCELKSWFPNHTILPYPTKETFEHIFAAFDTVLAADHCMMNDTHDFGNHLIILKECQFDKTLSMVDNLQKICRTRLSLPHCEKQNGIIAPQGFSWHSHSHRIVIHPMSTDLKKNWPAAKFIELANRLEKQGFAPYFCVSPDERVEWIKQVPETQLPSFATVHDLAGFVFESGSMIGNDSGIGHLASALNIPTLSLFARKSYSQLWRPGWGLGMVVTPPGILPGARLKQRYWKYLLSIRRVLRSFHKMRVKH